MYIITHLTFKISLIRINSQQSNIDYHNLQIGHSQNGLYWCFFPTLWAKISMKYSPHILTTNLAACVCVCVRNIWPISALRSHFFFKLREFFFRIAKFPYAAFGPLFAFHCPIFFTKNNTLNGVCMLNVTAAHWNNICYWGDYAIVSLRHLDSRETMGLLRWTFTGRDFIPLNTPVERAAT